MAGSGLNIAAGPAGQYVHWGVVQISVTNLALIAVMILLFVLALVVPMGSGRHDHQAEHERRPR